MLYPNIRKYSEKVQKVYFLNSSDIRILTILFCLSLQDGSDFWPQEKAIEQLKREKYFEDADWPEVLEEYRNNGKL